MTAPPMSPRKAAAVILIRDRLEGTASGQAEVFLLRRRKSQSFLSQAYVFPGGTMDDGENDRRATAARELFEEAGVLLSRQPLETAQINEARARVNAGEHFDTVIADYKAELDLDALHFFARWITPSAEKRRFDASFFVAKLPPRQTPSFDNYETVDETWVTSNEAQARSAELRLLPPQVRCFLDIQDDARQGVDQVLTTASQRCVPDVGIMPRLAKLAGDEYALLLPWDPDYDGLGTGDSQPLPDGFPLAHGPSRFLYRDGAWVHTKPEASST